MSKSTVPPARKKSPPNEKCRPPGPLGWPFGPSCGGKNIDEGNSCGEKSRTNCVPKPLTVMPSLSCRKRSLYSRIP